MKHVKLRTRTKPAEASTDGRYIACDSLTGWSYLKCLKRSGA